MFVLTPKATEGQPVTYHGSLVELHGRTLRAWICPCRRAHAVEQPRFMLADDAGRSVAWHVNPASISPG